MENNTKLTVVSQSSLLNKINSSIGITNKLIIENNKKLVAEIFESNPKFCVDLISEFYPLTIEMLSCENELNWEHINYYNNLTHLLNTLHISDFDKIPSFSWSSLSSNKNIDWSEKIIDFHLDKWDWKKLCGNYSIAWNEQMISKYIDKINWEGLSSNKEYSFSEILIDKYSDKFDFDWLSYNRNIDWTEKLLDKYQDKLNWSALIMHSSFWNKKLIYKFQKKIKWSEASRYGTFWNEELIVKHLDKIVWEDLSRNENILWNLECIETFKNKLDFGRLSDNTNIPWSEEVIEKYENKWSWMGYCDLMGLSANLNLPWSENLIETFSEKWDWSNLVCNNSIKWTIKFIHKNRNKLDYSNAWNPLNFWNVLKPYVDDEMVFKLLEDIKNGKIDINN